MQPLTQITDSHVLRDRGVPVHLAPAMAARVLLLQAGNAASESGPSVAVFEALQ